ncbi:MAG: SRPBCC family protein [Candidatus Freyarchaeum deiterrae]
MESITKNYKAKITAESGKPEIIITRDFDAPRELVFKAFTDPKIYIKWFGPRQLTTTLETFEPRNGGSWRYIQKDQNGNEYAFHGVFHEVLKPSRIIETYEFEGLPETGHVCLRTARFEEIPDGKTKMTAQLVFQSVADRDGMMQTGIHEGVNESFDRLEELLEKLQKKRSRSYT